MTRLPTKARESMGCPVGLRSPSVTTRARTALPTWARMSLAARARTSLQTRVRTSLQTRVRTSLATRARTSLQTRVRTSLPEGSEKTPAPATMAEGSEKTPATAAMAAMAAAHVRQRPRYPCSPGRPRFSSSWARKFPPWPAATSAASSTGRGRPRASTIRSASLSG